MIVILEDLQGNYILMLMLVTPCLKAELIRTHVFSFCSIIRVGGTLDVILMSYTCLRNYA